SPIQEEIQKKVRELLEKLIEYLEELKEKAKPPFKEKLEEVIEGLERLKEEVDKVQLNMNLIVFEGLEVDEEGRVWFIVKEMLHATTEEEALENMDKFLESWEKVFKELLEYHFEHNDTSPTFDFFLDFLWWQLYGEPMPKGSHHHHH
uniref:BBF-14_binder4 n=1 Tax=synthetic construct TaxID=32630 RepID=UPI0038D25ACC